MAVPKTTLATAVFRLSRYSLICWLLLSGLGSTYAGAQSSSARRGAFVYTGNTPYSGTSNRLINGYVIDATAGTLSPVTGSPFTITGQVLTIAAHPSGKFAYVAGGDGTVAAFTVDSLGGMLTPVPGSPFPAAAESGMGWMAGAVLAIDPAGKFLYVLGNNSLCAFTIDPASGALSAVAGSPFSLNGRNAYAIAVDPSGQYLVAASESSAWVFAIDGSTGALAAMGSEIGGQVAADVNNYADGGFTLLHYPLQPGPGL